MSWAQMTAFLCPGHYILLVKVFDIQWERVVELGYPFLLSWWIMTPILAGVGDILRRVRPNILLGMILITVLGMGISWIGWQMEKSTPRRNFGSCDRTIFFCKRTISKKLWPVKVGDKIENPEAIEGFIVLLLRNRAKNCPNCQKLQNFWEFF